MSNTFQKNIQMAITSIKHLTVDMQIVSGRKLNLKALKVWFLDVSKHFDTMVKTTKAITPTGKVQEKRDAVMKESNSLLVERAEKKRVEWILDHSRQEDEDKFRINKLQNNEDGISAKNIQKEKMTQEKIKTAILKNAKEIRALELSEALEVEGRHIVENEVQIFDTFPYRNMTTEKQDVGIELCELCAADDIDVIRTEERETVDDNILRVKETEKEEEINDHIVADDLEIVEPIKALKVIPALDIQRINREEQDSKSSLKKEDKRLERKENDRVRTIAFAKLRADQLAKSSVPLLVESGNKTASLILREEKDQEKLREAQMMNTEEIKALEVTQALEVKGVNREEIDPKTLLKQQEEKSLESAENGRVPIFSLAKLRGDEEGRDLIPSLVESESEGKNVILNEITVEEKLKEAQLKNIAEIKALELIQAEEVSRKGAEAIIREEKAFEMRKQERADRLASIVKAKEEEENKLAATLLKLEEETKALMVAKAKAHQSQVALEKADIELLTYNQSNDISAPNVVVDSLSLDIMHQEPRHVFEEKTESNPAGLAYPVIPSVAIVPTETLAALPENLANTFTNLQDISTLEHSDVALNNEEGVIEGEIITIPPDTEVEAGASRVDPLLVVEKGNDDKERVERVAKSSLEKEDRKRKIALEKIEQKKERDIAFAKLKADQLEKQSASGLSSIEIEEIRATEEKAVEDKLKKIALDKVEQKRVRDTAFAKLKADQLEKQSVTETSSSVDTSTQQPLEIQEISKEKDEFVLSQQLTLKDEEKPVVDREAEARQLLLTEKIATIKAQKDEEYKARTIAFVKQRADHLLAQKASTPVRAVLEIEKSPVLNSEMNKSEDLESIKRVKEGKEEEERQAAILEDWKTEESFLGLVREPSQIQVAEVENMRLLEERKEEDSRKLSELKAITEAKRAIDLSRARSIFEEIQIEMDLKEKKIEEDEEERKKEAEIVSKLKIDKELLEEEEVRRQAEMRRAEVQVKQKKLVDEARAEMSSTEKDREAKIQGEAARIASQLKLEEEETLKQAVLKKKVAESEFALSLEARQKEAGERIRRGEERRLALLDLKIVEEEMLMATMLKEEGEDKQVLAAFKVRNYCDVNLSNTLILT
jgi:hypothetical protein